MAPDKVPETIRLKWFSWKYYYLLLNKHLLKHEGAQHHDTQHVGGLVT